PKGTVHVISDIHGDDVKLRHVINNASGSLRPLVEQLFAGRLSPGELQDLLALILYPRETLEGIEPLFVDPAARRDFARHSLRHLFEIIRVLARRYNLAHTLSLLPADYSPLLQELLYTSAADQADDVLAAVVDVLARQQ